MTFDLRFLRDYWELDYKLDIWDYLRLELVSFLITKKIIRLAAERHGWRQMLNFPVFEHVRPYQK